MSASSLPTASAAPASAWSTAQEAQIRRLLAGWRSRHATAALPGVEDLWRELEGALWLELATSSRSLASALRRQLYLHYERPWRQRSKPLSHAAAMAHAQAAPSTVLEELDGALRGEALACLFDPQSAPQGSLKLAAQHFGGGNRQVARRRLTALLKTVDDGRPWRHLQRRTESLLARAQGQAPSRALGREAAALRRIYRLLTPDCCPYGVLSRLIRIAADGRRAGHPGNPESASACKAPHATARGTGS